MTEVYPNLDAWGIHGFTLTDKDAAFAKLSPGEPALNQTQNGGETENEIL